MEYYYVDGFAFSSREEYNLAIREQKNIQALRSKINMNNTESVLDLYKKLTSRNLLVTPIGLAFMKELRTYLLQCGYADTELPMIRVSEKSSKNDKQKYTNEQLVKILKVRDASIKSLKIVICGLIVLIVGMFAITLFFPNTGYVTYKKQLEDKYATWEDQISEREKAVQAKEEELGIDFSK